MHRQLWRCVDILGLNADANPLLGRGFMADKPCVSRLSLSPIAGLQPWAIPVLTIYKSWMFIFHQLFVSAPSPLLNSISNIPAVYLMSLPDWEKTVWPPLYKASFYCLTVVNVLVFMNLLVTRDFCPLFPASLEICGGIFFHKWNPPSVQMNYHFLMWIGIKLHLWLFIFA